MTNKALEKLIGHRVRIVIQEFPHSLATWTLCGKLVGSYGYHGVARNGSVKQYKHVDFYVDDEATDKFLLIPWNSVKLIEKCEDLGEAKNNG